MYVCAKYAYVYFNYVCMSSMYMYVQFVFVCQVCLCMWSLSVCNFKYICKCEQQEEHNQSIVCGGFKSYVDEYKIGLESLTTLLRRLVNEERYEREVINEFDSVIASIYRY